MSANNRQVGGAHYRSSNQHWDMVARYRLGYFEGQITKYITRHRFKKGREDAEKALHFAEKLLELHDTCAYQPIRKSMMLTDEMEAYGKANNLMPAEDMIILLAVNWHTREQLVKLVDWITKTIMAIYGTVTDMQLDGNVVNAVLHTPAQHATDGGDPDPRYVNQDGPTHG